MSKFITRVELHGATNVDYLVLHQEMRKRNFSQIIRGDDGKLYQLPPAEYFSFGDIQGEDVRELARDAADLTGKRSAVLVSEYRAAFWVGLQLA